MTCIHISRSPCGARLCGILLFHHINRIFLGVSHSKLKKNFFFYRRILGFSTAGPVLTCPATYLSGRCGRRLGCPTHCALPTVPYLPPPLCATVNKGQLNIIALCRNSKADQKESFTGGYLRFLASGFELGVCPCFFFMSFTGNSMSINYRA